MCPLSQLPTVSIRKQNHVVISNKFFKFRKRQQFTIQYSITTTNLNSCRDKNSFHQIKSHVFNRAFDAVSKLEGKIKGKRQTIPHRSIIFLH